MKKYKELKRNEGGFTLIELLVVIIILGILSGIVVFNVSGARANAQAKACQASADTLATALESYYSSNNLVYPAAAAAGPTGSYTEAEINNALAPSSGDKILRNPVSIVDGLTLPAVPSSGGYYLEVKIAAGGGLTAGGAPTSVTKLYKIVGHKLKLSSEWDVSGSDDLFLTSTGASACEVNF